MGDREKDTPIHKDCSDHSIDAHFIKKKKSPSPDLTPLTLYLQPTTSSTCVISVPSKIIFSLAADLILTQMATQSSLQGIKILCFLRSALSHLPITNFPHLYLLPLYLLPSSLQLHLKNYFQCTCSQKINTAAAAVSPQMLPNLSTTMNLCFRNPNNHLLLRSK